MRKLLVTAAMSVALVSGEAGAGGMAEPVVEPTVIEEDTAQGSRAGFLVPIIALVLIGLAISDDGDAPVAISDARLKTDVIRVGATAGGLPLYHFRYVGQPAVFEGVMAQDVLAFRPDAVVHLPGGYLGVDYGKLGLRLRAID